MKLKQVCDALGVALAGIGLRVPPWGVEKVVPPAALVTLPQVIAYDQTKGRGFDRFTDLQIVLLLARGNQRVTREELAEYTDGDGAKSVKAAVEAHDFAGACDTVRVVSAEFERVTYGDIPYDGVIFSLDITGRGATP